MAGRQPHCAAVVVVAYGEDVEGLGAELLGAVVARIALVDLLYVYVYMYMYICKFNES
jgi:hypothetical protein